MERKLFYIIFWLLLILDIPIIFFAVQLITRPVSYSSHILTETNRALLTPVIPHLPDQSAKTVDLSDIPPLYPNLIWITDTSELLGKSGIYREGNSASISGKQWVASKKGIAPTDMDTVRTGFRKYYDTELTKRGWYTQLKTSSGDTVIPLQADGPGGSIWGYIGSDNNVIRIVLLEEKLPPSGPDVQLNCPCDVTFTVFISDTIPIATILSQTK